MSKELPVFEEWPFKVPSIKVAQKKLAAFTEELKNAKSEKEALAIVKKKAKWSDSMENEFTHISVLFSIDTKNKKYEKAMTRLMNDSPIYEAASLEFSKAMKESKFRPYLEEKLGSFIFQMIDFRLKSFDEKIIPEAQKENELTMKYDALIAGAEIEFRGKTYNLPQMGKFMQDLDRETRKEASKAYYGYLSTIEDQIEDIYDQLVKVRDQMAKKLGFKNYVELGYIKMGRYDYTPEMVASYREQIREYVTPVAAKILKEQFKRTGIKNPHIYDTGLEFKEGNPLPMGTTQDKIEAAKKMYDALSPETSFFFRYMADHHVLDLEAKPGKQSGGYMTYFPKYKIPFIFSNFNGTSGDVDVLTHEFGHAFQAYMARNIKVPEYRSPTMESCEIHSMSMEFIAEPWMDLFFENPTKYRYSHLASSISFLPYGVTVDEFQHWVYEHPEATPAERDAEWVELEKKYTPYIVATYKDCEYRAKGHRWLTQGHIFSSPFYYIDYTLAQVMAFQFFNLDRKNHELAWKRYLNICKMGGKYPFVTLVTKDHMKSPFEPGVMKKTIAPLVKVLKSYKLD
ncbi:MAG: M3 family oligoendopeptidase [Bacilli bacterium]|jgi:M3 family oligoendopeptidase|nr:M3 family oligoendopeptidase [Bacilli bacterium]MEE3442434.1 M3 family oligoendopeptidase [Candidatus Enteromonas sp.]